MFSNSTTRTLNDGTQISMSSSFESSTDSTAGELPNFGEFENTSAEDSGMQIFDPGSENSEISEQGTGFDNISGIPDIYQTSDISGTLPDFDSIRNNIVNNLGESSENLNSSEGSISVSFSEFSNGVSTNNNFDVDFTGDDESIISIGGSEDSPNTFIGSGSPL